MAFPADVRTITLTGKYTDVSGNGASGSLAFNASVPLLVDAVGNALVTTSPVSVATSPAGTFSVVLLCTDQFTPSGWTWNVTESFTGMTARSYPISLPGSLGSTVDLSALAP